MQKGLPKYSYQILDCTKYAYRVTFPDSEKYLLGVPAGLIEGLIEFNSNLRIQYHQLASREDRNVCRRNTSGNIIDGFKNRGL